jgi:hypothetical protein
MQKHSLENVSLMALKIDIAYHEYRAAMPAATSLTAGLIRMISTDGLANLVYVVSLIGHGTTRLLREDRLDLSPVLPWL